MFILFYFILFHLFFFSSKLLLTIGIVVLILLVICSSMHFFFFFCFPHGFSFWFYLFSSWHILYYVEVVHSNLYIFLLQVMLEGHYYEVKKICWLFV